MSATAATHPPPSAAASARAAAPGRDEFLRRLRGVWRRARRRVHLGGLAALAAGLLALGIGLFLLDWMFLLPMPVRFAMLAAGLFGIGWVLKRTWIARLWPFDPARVALQLEEGRPGLRNLLVSYVQLDGLDAAQQGLSDGLLDGMRRQALRAAGTLDYAARPPDRVLRRALLALALAAGASAALAAALPVHMQVALRRILPPWPPMGYPTKTRVARLEWIDHEGRTQVLWERSGHGTIVEWERLPGAGAPRVVLPEGAAATLRVALIPEGRRPAEATMHWRNRGGAWESAFVARDAAEGATPPPAGSGTPPPADGAAPASADGEAPPPAEAAAPPPADGAPEAVTYTFRRDRVLADFEFWFSVGDARTVETPVTVAAAPRVLDATVAVAAPAYTRIPENTIAGLDLNGIVAGSTLGWTLRLSERVGRAEALYDDGRAEEMGIDDDGRTVRWSRTLPDPLSYRFRWRRVDYPDFVYEEDVRRHVGVVPDEPPAVEMARPRRDLMATAEKRLAVEYRVADDCGIDRIWLAYSLNEGDEKLLLMEDFSAKDAAVRRTFEGTFVWAPKNQLPNLVDGDMIGVTVVASDRSGKDPRKPVTGRSASVRIQVLSREAYHLWALDQQDMLLNLLEDARRESDEVGRRIDETLAPAPAEDEGTAAGGGAKEGGAP